MNPMNVKYTCDNHKFYSNNAISPCRAICHHCRQKKVHGYENPDHVPNPFGYLFLFPKLCLECSHEQNTCMWCPEDDTSSDD